MLSIETRCYQYYWSKYMEGFFFMRMDQWFGLDHTWDRIICVASWVETPGAPNLPIPGGTLVLENHILLLWKILHILLLWRQLQPSYIWYIQYPGALWCWLLECEGNCKQHNTWDQNAYCTNLISSYRWRISGTQLWTLLYCATAAVPFHVFQGKVGRVGALSGHLWKKNWDPSFSWARMFDILITLSIA